MTSISVVISTLGKDDYLDYTLASLVNQTHRDFEVIVVNDGGAPSTGKLVASYSDRIPITYQELKHKGMSAARNSGIDVATGDRLVLLDDDRICQPDFIAVHARHADDEIVVGWKKHALTIWKRDRLALNESDFVKLSQSQPGGLTWLADNEKALIQPSDLIDDFAGAVARIDLGDDGDNHPKVIDRFPADLEGFDLPWALVTTGNLSVSRSGLAAVNGFNESYIGWGLEDTDLAYRLHQIGQRTVIDMDAVNLHQVHPQGEGTVHEAYARRWFQALRNTHHFLRSYPTVEAFVYRRVLHNNFDILEANDLVRAVKAAGSPTIEAELVRLYSADLPAEAAA